MKKNYSLSFVTSGAYDQGLEFTHFHLSTAIHKGHHHETLNFTGSVAHQCPHMGDASSGRHLSQQARDLDGALPTWGFV
jgi:hypothetical protein